MATAIDALRRPMVEPSGANPSGVQPMDKRVVIRPDSAETVTAGGIILPPSSVDQEKYAATKGTLVAIGENAFSEAEAERRGFLMPKPGDRVMYAKYGGISFEVGGQEYRIMNDEDVIGRLIGETSEG